MSTRWTDPLPALRRSRAWILGISLLAAAGQVEARLLLFEDPLRATPLLGTNRHKLEFGSEYFSCRAWAGQRHTLRYVGSRGSALAWSISLPWLYSSYSAPGESGRDNPRFAANLRLLGSGQGALRLGAEFWLPFSDDMLYPLQQRRAFGRVSLMSLFTGGPFRLRTAFSHRWELVGIGEDRMGDDWPDRQAADLRLDRMLPGGRSIFLEGGITFSPDAATWTRVAGGLSVAWAEYWRVECLVETTLGNQSDPDLHDYRIAFRLSRDLPRPELPAAPIPGDEPPPEGARDGEHPEEAAPAGEAPAGEIDAVGEAEPAEEGEEDADVEQQPAGEEAADEEKPPEGDGR